MKIIEVNVTDGTTIEREGTAEEKATLEQSRQLKIDVKNKAIEDETKRQALLNRLGITADEARLLIG